MPRKTPSGSIISDVLNGAGDPDLFELFPRGSLDMESSKLQAAPPQLAERFLTWRVLEALTHRQSKELLFWSLAFARYHGLEADQETTSELIKIIANVRF